MDALVFGVGVFLMGKEIFLERNIIFYTNIILSFASNLTDSLGMPVLLVIHVMLIWSIYYPRVRKKSQCPQKSIEVGHY